MLSIHQFFLWTLRACDLMELPAPDGIDVERVSMAIPNGWDCPLAICALHKGSVWVGHYSKITAYDWALRKHTTKLTDLHSVETMNRVSETLAAVGADDFLGLHIYDTKNASHVKSLTWSDKPDTWIYGPCVRAIASTDSSIFASFENGRRLWCPRDRLSYLHSWVPQGGVPVSAVRLWRNVRNLRDA